VPSLLLQRGPEARKVFRPGILPDRAGDPLHGVIVLLGLESQQAHQVQRVGVIGIHRERLPATQLSLEMSPGLHMGESGLVERSGFAYARRLRAIGGHTFAIRWLLISSAGCPTFAAIHWRISR
jgi:hypothetical protein